MAAAGDEAAKESKLRLTGALRALPPPLLYLYATVKTHIKEVYGWRFIAGGCDISMGVVSDWIHRACRGHSCRPLTSSCARRWLICAGRPSVPQGPSWILRDGRGVVQRICDLESSLRAERHGADGAAQAAGYAAWQLVEFGVHETLPRCTSGGLCGSPGGRHIRVMPVGYSPSIKSYFHTLPHDEIRRSMGGVDASCGRPSLARAARSSEGDDAPVPSGRRAPRRERRPTTSRAASSTRRSSSWRTSTSSLLVNIFVTLGDDVYRQTLLKVLAESQVRDSSTR